MRNRIMNMLDKHANIWDGSLGEIEARSHRLALELPDHIARCVNEPVPVCVSGSLKRYNPCGGHRTRDQQMGVAHGVGSEEGLRSALLRRLPAAECENPDPHIRSLEWTTVSTA